MEQKKGTIVQGTEDETRLENRIEGDSSRKDLGGPLTGELEGMTCGISSWEQTGGTFIKSRETLIVR
jgi:hypothetical protein